MPKGIPRHGRAEREAALASLDEVVFAAAAEVAASATQRHAYQAEIDEIDATIERLRKRRVEVYGLRQAHIDVHARIRTAAYTRVNDLCNAGRVASGRRLVIAAHLVYGSDNAAITTALHEGRKLLQTLDDEPFLCSGYIWLTRHGMWCGARTAESPRVDLVSGEFCIVIPIVLDGESGQCNVAIRNLAERNEATHVSRADAYIGEENIVAGLSARLKGVSVDSPEYADILAALQDAGFGSGRSQSMLAAAIAAE